MSEMLEMLEKIFVYVYNKALFCKNWVVNYVHNYYTWVIQETIRKYHEAIDTFLYNHDVYWPRLLDCYGNKNLEFILLNDHIFIPVFIVLAIVSILYMVGFWVAVLKYVCHVGRSLKRFVKEVWEILKKK